MDEAQAKRNCPDCGGDLEHIKVVGRGWRNPISGIAIDTEVTHYVKADEKRSTFRVMFKRTRPIRSCICRGCKRVYMYGA